MEHPDAAPTMSERAAEKETATMLESMKNVLGGGTEEALSEWGRWGDPMTLLTPRIALSSVALSMLGCALLALVLRAHFVRLATRSTGDRGQFGNTLVMVALATTLVILTIKSSLALSLGLVGALSVIRFRTPVKEPEELAYLFLAVGLGVGMGAEVVVETALAFGVVLLVAGVLLFRTRRASSRVGMTLIEIELDGAVNGETLAGNLLESSLRATLVRVSAGSGPRAHWVFALREATQGQLLAGLARVRATWPDARVVLHQAQS